MTAKPKLTLAQMEHRIDKMAAWAKKMEDAIRPQPFDTTALEENAQSLYARYKDVGKQTSNAVKTLLDLQEQQRPLKSAVSSMLDNALFEVASEVNDEGKPLYGNDTMRKAAADKALTDNESYKSMRVDLANLDSRIYRQKATIAYLEAETKAYGRRNALYIAQLNLASAKLNYLKETK